MKNIFVTGISGVVGHYLFDYLKENQDYQFYFLVRNPKKLAFNPQDFKNVKIIHDVFENIGNYKDLLKEMDYFVHLAADWVSAKGNYDHTVTMLEAFDPNCLKKGIYFSTASILDQNNQTLEAAGKYGTPYIQGKYLLHQKLPQLKIASKVITLFPTWVIGGDSLHPYSHAAQGILSMKKWLWLLRFFSLNVRYHYIHAKDIAMITNHLLENDVTKQEFVLGNPAISVNDFIKEACEYFQKRVYFQIPVSPQFIYKVTQLLRRKLPAWDAYCLNNPDQLHQTVNPESFGLTSNYKTVEQILIDLFNKGAK